ncbi:MAG: (2Fe-2S)-binding protein [Candidatus Aminicenantes bacterium]|nr:(2Fe-2S)-binding protein [Candidatus Aminicenantes bacterium]
MEDLRINSVERKNKITIKVNGKEVIAYTGETLLAALIASGYKQLKKSPVLKENRGGLCGMGVCYECLVTIDGEKNVRACMEDVRAGMEIGIEE